jgi:hypothetical protein
VEELEQQEEAQGQALRDTVLAVIHREEEVQARPYQNPRKETQEKEG